jgi:CHASE3 domain sensor protein
VATTLASPAVERPGLRRLRGHGLPTPTWIIALAMTCAILAVVLGAFVSAVAGSVREGVRVIGREAAPQVSATTGLYFALSDMDAQLANVLLAGTDPGLAANRQEASDLYQQRRVEATGDLERIAAGASDDGSRKAVADILDRLGRYESLAGQVTLLNEREGNAAGRPSSAVLQRHREATDLMRDTLHEVHDLTSANQGLLNQTYQDRQAGALEARVWLWIIGGLLAAALVALQVFLRVRLGRRLNPAALLATIIVATTVVVGSMDLSREAQDLTVAKANAFDSIVALSQARAVGYDANADESRYLVDPGRATQYERSFLDKSQSLVTLTDTEMNNITFAGEREAAEHALAAFQLYERDDRTIRAKATSGDLRGAIAFCVGSTPGNSNYDFGQYDKALIAVIDINQRAFDEAVSAADGELTGWSDVVPLGVPVAVTVLVAAGVWRRLAEYR